MKDILMPGDIIATSEEYIPGEGTYEKDGSILAAVAGIKEFDEDEKIARVRSVNSPLVLKVDDIVIGVVERIGSSMATVEVSNVVGNPRKITGNVKGTLHISKVSEGYTDDVRKNYRLGDIVRARVSQVSPSLQLRTNSKDLGVLKTRCLKCRAVLEKADDGLYCEDCDRVEHRKLAEDYGDFTAHYESNKNPQTSHV